MAKSRQAVELTSARRHLSTVCGSRSLMTKTGRKSIKLCVAICPRAEWTKHFPTGWDRHAGVLPDKEICVDLVSIMSQM